jgi:hypothetical protein
LPDGQVVENSELMTRRIGLRVVEKRRVEVADDFCVGIRLGQPLFCRQVTNCPVCTLQGLPRSANDWILNGHLVQLFSNALPTLLIEDSPIGRDALKRS